MCNVINTNKRFSSNLTVWDNSLFLNLRFVKVVIGGIVAGGAGGEVG